jgi:Na+/proline symporter
MLKEEIKNIDSSEKELKKFGFTIGAVFSLIAAILYYYSNLNYIWLISAGMLFFALALTLPKLLLPLQKGWMILALILGTFSSHVILLLLFYLVITPIGLLGRIFGKDFLDEKFDVKTKTYWNYRKAEKYSREKTEKQF